MEKTIGLTEQNTWFGWPLVLVALAALVLLWRRSSARVGGVAGGGLRVAALGPKVRFDGVRDRGIDGPWAYIPDDLPLFGC